MAHFYDLLPKDIKALSNAEAVQRYRAGAGVPGEAIVGLTPVQLNAVPIPGTWSIQQIVCHLADTDQVASYRMKRIIAEERPRIDAYDENGFAERLHCDKQDAAEVCELFQFNRLVTARMLGELPDAAFERAADHPEIGPLPLGVLLRLYVHHLDHHMAFLLRKRSMVTGRTD